MLSFSVLDNFFKRVFLFFALCSISITSAAKTQTKNNIDIYLINAMKAYHIPIVGYAIIENNKIVSAKTLSIDPQIKVSVNSLFQAASISKSVSAYGALKLISDKKFELNDPANKLLKSWKIPINKYNKKDPVTIRQILNMTSGLSVSGYPGYTQEKPLPSLLNILNGTPPANSPPIRVFYKPGSRHFYSGGSYQVLQQVIEDTTHQPFNEFMKISILKPLKMTHSIYQYPLSKKLKSEAIPGFWADGKMLTGGWNNYAIAASGGLWSTPSDIAKFAINIVKSFKGNKQGLIPKKLAADMLHRGKNTSFGLGVVVNGHDKSLNFRKNGHNFGYYDQLIMFPNTGQGLVIMTNSDNGMEIINYIMPIIAHQYHWPCYFPVSFELTVIPEFACYSS